MSKTRLQHSVSMRPFSLFVCLVVALFDFIEFERLVQNQVGIPIQQQLRLCGRSLGEQSEERMHTFALSI